MDAAALQPCPTCGTELDVSELEPLAEMECPVCSAPFQVQRRYGPFVPLQKLGEGGMGSVFRALDESLDRQVALKILRRDVSSDEEFVAKFEAEARITASVNHPHVVRVFSFGQDAGQYYLAMELVAGGSLDELMQLQGTVAEPQALEVGVQIAEGLQAAYEAGLIHRDVKPGNILFADAHTAKITDFGLARPIDDAEGDGEIWGTPYYIAPEKLDKRPEDFRSDIYSLGGTLFHAIAGRPPFEAQNATLVALKHLKSQAVSLQAFAPNVSSETAYVVNRMLAKEPEDRYESYAECLAHLRYALDQWRERTARPRQRERAAMENRQTQTASGWLTLAVLVLLVLGAVATFVFRDRIFHAPPDPAAPVAAPRVPTDAGAREKLDEARRLLVEGQAGSALELLRGPALSPDTPRPLRDWMKFHAGLAALLDRDTGAAREWFEPMQREKLFSEEPARRKLANLFPEVARVMADNRPVQSAVRRQYDGRTVEAMGLLAFGLKNWKASEFESSVEFLRAFVEAPATREEPWIGEFKPLAQRYLDDWALAGPVLAKLRAGDPAGRIEAEAALGKVRTGEPLLRALRAK
ncbi:MAG: serine/threonine protein kinase [Verrucomicrobia bacterium]|nr:serine/threonine protein kinase [Verrucomicrobiota bacterium]